MAILNILTAPDPRLNAVGQAVDKVDRSVRRLMEDLLETMIYYDGVGLAALQAGIQKRVIAVNLGERNGIPFKPLLMANPEIHWVSPKMQVTREGCLSVPYFAPDIMRPYEVKMTYVDENNEKKSLEASGLLADVIQHEVDHLNGILTLDHVSNLKRNLILQKLRKQTKVSR